MLALFLGWFGLGAIVTFMFGRIVPDDNDDPTILMNALAEDEIEDAIDDEFYCDECEGHVTHRDIDCEHVLWELL